MDLETLLTDRLARSFSALAGEPVDPVVRRSRHADFQAEAALSLARRLGRTPGRSPPRWSRTRRSSTSARR
ncbi:hypothetical protein GCM10027615_26240 [Plantactinospora veratri]